MTRWPQEVTPDSSPDQHARGRHGRRGNPVWVRLATYALVIYLLGWALSLMPNPDMRAAGAAISPATTSISLGLGLASTILLVFWFPAWLRNRSVRTIDGAQPEEAAIADEYKITPVSRVSVHVKVWPHWRYPFWLVRKVVVHLPRGRVTADPALRICPRLEPLLGPVRVRSWHPRRGRLVLRRAILADQDEVDIPDVEEDPQRRAVQALEGVLKTDQLRTEAEEYDEHGNLTAFQVRHPTNVRMASADAETTISERLGRMMPDAPGERGWAVTVDPQRDLLRIHSRTPIPPKLDHPLLDYAAEFGDQRFIPYGRGEHTRWIGWDISSSTQCPHCLLVGPTGGGKTSTIRSIVVGATRQSGTGANQVEIWGLDPKMIELMGVDNWPGVTRLAFTVEEMAALINAAHDEMMSRYHRIRSHQVHRSELPALIVILDEYFILRSQLIRWWKEDLGNKGQPPHLGMLNEMLALARAASVYLCIGIQRPDASNFDDGARDNMRTRVAHSPLFEEARKMMWGHPSKGIMSSSGVRGRVMASGPDGEPEETQQFWTPDLDQHPVARQHMSQQDIELVDILRPADYTPYTITTSGLYVPRTDSREIPSGSSQSEMMDEQAEIVRARDLAEGDRVKMNKGGRWEFATVEQNSYEPGDDTLDLDIVWDQGGGGETVGGLDDGEEIYVVEHNLAHA